MSETINISGDTFEVSYEGECSVGGWKIADAPNQHIAVVPQSVGEDKIKEVMNDRYLLEIPLWITSPSLSLDFEMLSITRIARLELPCSIACLKRSICIVLRSDPVEDFIEVLNSM